MDIRKKAGLTRHCGGRVRQVLDARGPRAVSEERDALLVPAKVLDVLLRPLQDGHLVHDPVIGHLAAGQGGPIRIQETWNVKEGHGEAMREREKVGLFRMVVEVRVWSGLILCAKCEVLFA